MDRIGILAGGGRLPVLVAESVVAHGGRVHIVAIDGEADQEIARYPHTWVNWGQIGRMVTTLRAESGGEMVIAGGVRRPDLWKLRPDRGFFQSLPQLVGLLAGGDDSVLSRVVRFFEAKGFTVRGAHEVAPELRVAAGPVGGLALSVEQRADATLGFAVRAALGPLDAGQAVTVAKGRVVAIEGAEGTDAMLQRIAGLGGVAAGGVLTKGPKPGQELRVDMPAIGPRTVEAMVAAGLSGLALEAGAVLVLGREQVIAQANAQGIAVEGLAGTGAGARPSMPLPAVGRVLGRRRPGPRDRVDIAKGLAAVRSLAPFGAGEAVVVARAYILAVAAGEPVTGMLERVGALRQWGLRGKGRVGVLVCRLSLPGMGESLETVCEVAKGQGLAGLVLAGPEQALHPFADGCGSADVHGLFLVVCPDG